MIKSFKKALGFSLFIFSAVFIENSAAETVNIDLSSTGRYSFTADNQKFLISPPEAVYMGGTSTDAVITVDGYRNGEVEVTTDEIWNGLFVSWVDVPAIEVKNSGSLTTINANSVITSGVTPERGATIYLNGSGGTTTINNADGNYLYNHNSGADGIAIQTTEQSGTELILNNGNGYIMGRIIVGGDNLAAINNSGGYITGAIDLGANADSVITNNDGYLYDITMRNSDQKIVMNNGYLFKANGPGTIYYENDSYATNDIGAVSKIGKVVVADGKSLSLVGGSDKIFNADVIQLGVGSILDPRATQVSGTLTPTQDGAGSINFLTDTANFNVDIGTSNNRLGQVYIYSERSVDIGNHDYNVVRTDMYADGAITLGSGEVSGIFDSLYGSNATVNISADNNFSSNVKFGDTNGLSSFNVLANADVVVNSSINSTNVAVKEESSLNVAAGKNISGNVVLSENASLILNEDSSVDGTIKGATSGVGSITFNSDYVLKNNIEDIANVILKQDVKLNLDQFTLESEKLTLEAGSSVVLASGTLDVNLIMGENSSLRLGQDAIVNISENSPIEGTIDGISSGQGTLNFSGNVIVNSQIGGSATLGEININQGSNVILNEDLGATNINVSGALSLGDSSRALNGNLIMEQNSALNLGSASHQVSGNFTTNSGSAIALDILGKTTSGNLEVAGQAFLNANTILSVTVLGATVKDQVYEIISASDGSSLNAISKENIIVTSAIGSYSFSTFIDGNKLMLKVDSSPTPPFSGNIGNNQNQRTAYESLINNSRQANGALASLMQFLNSTAAIEAKNAAINSIIPQVDNSPNRIVFDNVSSSLNMIGNRLNSLRGTSLASGEEAEGVASGDEGNKKNVWIQHFASKIDQGNTSASPGYKANSMGVAFGGDHEIATDLTLGISGSYAGSSTKSRDGLKHTSINTYQANIYSGYNTDKYFLNSMIGFAWNEYKGKRSIPLFGLTASSKYSGKSYMARIEGGSMEKLPNHFILTPIATLTMAYNQLGEYTEEGAGALNLHVKNDSTSFFETRLGFKLNRKFLAGNIVINPEFSSSYGYDFAGSKQKTINSFVGQQATFDSSSARIAQGSFKTGAGLGIYMTESTQLNMNYDYEYRRNYQANVGSLKLKHSF